MIADSLGVPYKPVQSAYRIWKHIPDPIKQIYYDKGTLNQSQMLLLTKLHSQTENMWILAIAAIHEQEHGRTTLSGYSNGGLTRVTQLMAKENMGVIEALSEFGVRFEDIDKFSAELTGIENIIKVQKAAILSGKSLDEYYLQAIIEHSEKIIAISEQSTEDS